MIFKKKTNNTPVTVQSQLKNMPSRWLYDIILAVVVLILVVYSFTNTEFNPSRLANFGKSLSIMIKGFLHPNTNFLFGLDDASVPYLTLQTISIAFVGTVIAAILALPISFITSKNIVGKFSKVGEIILILIRTFPEIVLALVLIRAFGPGALTGALTIGIHSIGMLGKLFAESIENMDRGPLEALDAVGANIWQKIRYGIIPQVLPDFISTTLYRFDINVRAATVLGVVSAGGLGTPLIFATREWNWSTLSSILIAIIIMVVVVDLISSKLRARLV
jgi:phosphonate transport system permease protein